MWARRYPKPFNQIKTLQVEKSVIVAPGQKCNKWELTVPHMSNKL